MLHQRAHAAKPKDTTIETKQHVKPMRRMVAAEIKSESLALRSWIEANQNRALLGAHEEAEGLRVARVQDHEHVRTVLPAVITQSKSNPRSGRTLDQI